MSDLILQSFRSLKDFCEKENFKGWDPYDGLNSALFQSIPGIGRSRFFRLLWIQFFKKSPINLRPLVKVPKEFNAKGIGLFLTGYCNLYRMDSRQEYKEKIHFLADHLLDIRSPGYSGSCWGYNFDWQARAFFQPKQTPTVVATSFVADALFNAYDITAEKRYLDAALSAAQFVLKDLNRTYDAAGNFSFSYSPLDKTQVFNASLLGARLLSRAFAYNHEPLLKEEAGKAVQYACHFQREDGAWAYGILPYHQWIDSFHTGFNLECIYQYQQYTGDHRFTPNIEKGLKYYLDNFFTAEGMARYYDHGLYPIDIHAPAQLIATLYKLECLDRHRDLAERVLTWTINHMQSRKGYFYYQHQRFISSKICYMRWAQAWMFYAMSYYLLSLNTRE